MDFQVSEDLPDIILYQAVVCLEMLTHKILAVNGLDVPVLYDYSVQCEEVLSKLCSCEANVFYKSALQQLMQTICWHKKLLHFHIKRSTNLKDNPFSKNDKDLKCDSKPTQKIDDEEMTPRRRTILSTIVNNKKIRLNDVAGLTVAKQTLKEAIIIPLQFPHLFTGIRKSWTSILLYGPPGTGKSRLGQAIAAEIDSTFFSVSSADLLSSFVGESEKLIKELFCYAHKVDGTSVVFIDEIDSISRKRSSSEDEHSRRVKTELLKQMDGIDGNPDTNKVFLLCATNCPWELDVAFLRRFQRRIYIPLPDRLARLDILRLHMQDNAVNFSDSEWDAILCKTDGFSGSDLASLTMSAMFQPIRELQMTTCWMKTQDGHVKPAVGDVQAAILCQLDELPPSQVIPRQINLNDFMASLNSTHRTVTPQDLSRYEEFTRCFGQLG